MENDFIDELFEELTSTLETWFGRQDVEDLIDLEIEKLEEFEDIGNGSN